jgi:hypothetical protein
MSEKKITEKQGKANLEVKEEKKSNCGCGCTPLSGSTLKASPKKV